MLETPMNTSVLIMQKSEVADNQQRSLDMRLSWLGGIVDGEGMITLIKRTGKIGKNENGYTPRISIVNTDKKLINEVSRICKMIEVPYYIQTKKASGNWKEKEEVLFCGIKRCAIFLPYIMPHLISKKWKAELLSEFCKSRLSKKKNATISDREHEIAQNIRVGHTTGPKSKTLNDYTPSNSKRVEDIV